MTWTPLIYVWPRRYLQPEHAVNISPATWSNEFDWREDSFNGWLDVAKEPRDTIATQTGDCEDYALVIASWALANDIPVTLGFCTIGVVPRHVVAVTPGLVWSSGNVHDTTLDEYLKSSKYDHVITRDVSV